MFDVDTMMRLFRMDDFTLLQILMVGGVCGFIVSQIMQGWITPILCNIGLIVAAVISNMVFRGYGVAITYNKDLDGILFTTAGVIGGLMVVFLTILTFSAFNNQVGNSAQRMREKQAAEAAGSIQVQIKLKS